MHLRKKIIGMGILALIACACFLFWDINPMSWGYSIPRRIRILAAIVLTASNIGFSTVIFQTLTNNRILTPSIMGLDSLYLFVQTFVVFTFGSHQLTSMTASADFLISVGIMVAFSFFLYRVLFVLSGLRIFTVVLTGLVLGSLFSSLSTFMQVMIDPNEFLIVQDQMFSSFNNINTTLLGIASAISILIFAYGFTQTRKLDVLSLGRDVAVNLGVDYTRTTQKFMILCSFENFLANLLTLFGKLFISAIA